MEQKKYLIVLKKTVAALMILMMVYSCSLFPSKQNVQITTKPLERQIVQPVMPRQIDLKEPYWYVVSEAVIANPYKKNEEGKRDESLGKEHPEWPEGYTYLDKFLDEMRKQNNGDAVFVAMSVSDYELMSMNMQELRRYIREVQEVVVYYRNVTIKNPDGTSEQGVGASNTNDSRRPSIGIFPRNKDE